MLCSCEQDAQSHKSMWPDYPKHLSAVFIDTTMHMQTKCKCNISIFEPYAHVLCRYTYSHQQLGCALTQHWYTPPHIHTATRTNTNTCIHTHARTYVQTHHQEHLTNHLLTHTAHKMHIHVHIRIIFKCSIRCWSLAIEITEDIYAAWSSV